MQTGIVRIPFRFRLTRYRASSSRPLIGHFNKPRVNEWKIFWKRRDIGGRIGKRKEKRKKKTRPKEKVVSLVPSSCREACLPDRAPLMECQPPVVENFFLDRKRKPPPSLGLPHARRIITENSATTKRNISPGCVVWARLVLRTVDR